MSLDVYKFEKIKGFNNPIFILGAFESFHLGHYELFKKAKAIQAENGGDIVLVFFKDIENLYKYGDRFIFSDFQNRLQEFANLGFNNAIYLEYSAVSKLEPEDFITKLIFNQNNYKIVVGEDFKYGNKAKGNTQSLNNQVLEGSLFVVPFLKLNDNVKISTRFLKECLELGDLDLVNSLNCYTYSFNAVVKASENLICSLEVDDNLIIVRAGLYAVYAEINGYSFYGILRSNIDGEYDIFFLDFKLKKNEKINCRIKVLKALRFINDYREMDINEKDIDNAKKEFISK
ncbi:FAD synthase [Mycoplasmopsis felifaucium]|uniref:FAD synthase n=1 Tax=Mycoplasmopsis felifaucium TaxID=35768 RepID=A0ABZ2RPD6_9BACT